MTPQEFDRLPIEKKLNQLFKINYQAIQPIPTEQLQRLKEFNQIHAQEKKILRKELNRLKAELAKEKRRSARYKQIGDEYRKQIAAFLQQNQNNPKQLIFKK